MYTEYRPTSGLTVLEVHIPTGYIVKNETLRDYVRSGVVSNLKQAMFYSRKLVYYFSQVCSRAGPVYDQFTFYSPIYLYCQNETLREYVRSDTLPNLKTSHVLQ